ncbi:four helix bundle protein [Reichenbachiella agariperforans]|uniref:four helix bundle protein n=1 Tax=Reichenbachiella agariperforans TaxID=156994 RepID=UPI001C091EC2|nr:four helix bundle protein [Reichenbachiella agariperforans]MBU2914651.1 four helix bundle protein [Reichenbachiella agariperforans]
MHDFRKLNIWKRSIDLVTEIYQLTSSFPEAEKFGLTSQIRRCSVSVPSNIAEGAGRKSDKEFVQFLSIAMGSLCELETQLIISKNLKLINSEQMEVKTSEINEIQKMIRVLGNSLKSNSLNTNI